MRQVILYLLLMLFFSCGIGKGGTNLEKHQLVIKLTEQVKPKAIIADYTSLGLTDLKTASLSQPLYTTTVNLNKPDLTKLINALKADDRVVSVHEPQNSDNSSSTNTGFGTSRPKN